MFGEDKWDQLPKNLLGDSGWNSQLPLHKITPLPDQDFESVNNLTRENLKTDIYKESLEQWQLLQQI